MDNEDPNLNEYGEVALYTDADGDGFGIDQYVAHVAPLLHWVLPSLEIVTMAMRISFRVSLNGLTLSMEIATMSRSFSLRTIFRKGIPTMQNDK